VQTAFDYMYRDAGNFKAFGSVLLDGPITKLDEDLVRQSLDGGEYFIAEQVEVPPLYDQLYRWSDGPTESDHCWHEYVGFRQLTTPSEPTLAITSVREFIGRFAAVASWDGRLSPHFK
jgi:hypothetical protein